MDLDLLAIAVSGGGSVPRALEIVRQEAGREAGPTAQRVLELATRAGVPAAGLLRAEADQARREHLAAAQIRVARLGVTLLLPLGVCVLPAFVALGLAPLLLSVLTQTISRF
jgi:tight adherence protein B